MDTLDGTIYCAPPPAIAAGDLPGDAHDDYPTV